MSEKVKFEVGQVWQHTAGDEMRIVALNVPTHFYGMTTLAEHPDGSFTPVSDDKESMVNWTLTTEKPECNCLACRLLWNPDTV